MKRMDPKKRRFNPVMTPYFDEDLFFYREVLDDLKYCRPARHPEAETWLLSTLPFVLH